MSDRELEEFERNVVTRTKVDSLISEVHSLNTRLTKHMDQEDEERRRLDKKLLYLFLLSTGLLVVDHGSGVMLMIAKLFIGG